MGIFTDAETNLIRDHLFGGATKGATNYDVVLCETITDENAGTITEVAGTGSGAKVAGTDFDWDRGTAEQASNDAELRWTNGSGGNWTVEGYALKNGGTVVAVHTFASVRTVPNGTDIFFAIGGAVATL